MSSKGKAYAIQKGGNNYCVRYERSGAMDRNVPYGYLRGLVESGYEVHVARSGYGGGYVGTLKNGITIWTQEARQ